MSFVRSCIAAGACAAVLALLGPMAASAHASACSRYGDTSPAQLARHQAEDAVQCLLNRKRSTHGLPPLAPDDRLRRAAQRHSGYMREHQCFSHQCPGEASIRQRLKRVHYLHAGLASWAYGENIGWGTHHFGTPKGMVKAWMQSPEHRHNILEPSFHDLGVGFTHGSPSDPDADGGIYTTDFGERKK
jgi:uncharacterized protein YkwD